MQKQNSGRPEPGHVSDSGPGNLTFPRNCTWSLERKVSGLHLVSTQAGVPPEKRTGAITRMAPVGQVKGVLPGPEGPHFIRQTSQQRVWSCRLEGSPVTAASASSLQPTISPSITVTPMPALQEQSARMWFELIHKYGNNTESS